MKVKKLLKNNYSLIKCKGYSKFNEVDKMENPEKCYKTAKQPVGKFDEVILKDLNEVKEWIEADGWIGLRLNNLTVIDVDKDDCKIDLVKWYINQYFKDKQQQPVIQKTKNGYHYFFKQFTQNNKPYNNSDYLSGLGVNLTVKSGENAYILIEPSEGKEWITEPDFDNLPELPDALKPLDKNNKNKIIDAIVSNIAFCYQNELLNGYEDIELSFCCFLIKENFDNDYIHDAFKFIYPDYDYSRTNLIIERTRERLKSGEEVKGIRSLSKKIKGDSKFKVLKKLLDLFFNIQNKKNHQSEENKTTVILSRFEAKKIGNIILNRFSFWFEGQKKDFWYYDEKDGLWKNNAEDFIKSYLYKEVNLDSNFQKKHYLNEIIEYIKYNSYRDGASFPEPSPFLIPFKNGVYDLKNDKFRAFYKEDFLTYKIPHNYNENTKCPFLDNILHSLVPKDRVVDLYELIAYCLWRGYPYQKFFIIYGKGSNGKSIFAKILKEFLGKDNCSDISLDEIQKGGFLTNILHRKLANISGEISYKDLKETRLLKQLTGEDSILADRKYKEPISFVNYAKLIFLTNQIPMTYDTTDAFFRRVFLIEFPYVFSGENEDKSLFFKIIQKREEFSGLANKVIYYLKNLIKNGFKFTNDQDISEIKLKYQLLSNPIVQFISLHCEEDPDGFIIKEEFAERLNEWLLKKGFSKMDESMIGKRMKALKYEDGQKSKYNFKRGWLKLKWKNYLSQDENCVVSSCENSSINKNTNISRGSNNKSNESSQVQQDSNKNYNIKENNKKKLKITCCSCDTCDKNFDIKIEEEKLHIFKTKPLDDIPNYQLNTKPIPYNELKKFYFDIESTGLDPKTSKLICIGVMDDTGNVKIFKGKENKILLEFNTYILKEKPDILAGHNIFNFDIPYLVEKSRQHKIKPIFELIKENKVIGNTSWKGKPITIDLYKCSNKNVNLIDTFILTAKYDYSARKLKSYSLKNAVIKLKLRENRRLELSKDDIVQLFKSGDLNTIEEYLKYDLEDTKLLADLFIPQYHYQLELFKPETRINLQNLCLMGQATKWNIILSQYYSDKPKPDNKKKYEGGLVIANKGLFRNCAKIDVASLYPSIMLLYRIHTKKDTKAISLSILKYLTQERLRLKKLAKSGDKEADYK